MRVLGLMSGTSLDGVTGVVAEFVGDRPGSLGWSILGSGTVSYDPRRRERILEVIRSGGAPELAALHRDLGEWFAAAAVRILADAEVEADSLAAVASHGQTIWHEPPRGGERGHTLQLGDPATIAEALGVDVVSDFRSRDMAAGGHGAPLVPWPDAVLFSRDDRGRALQNIGGMANVTVLPRREAAGRAIPFQGVRAFDTGPGVALVDGAVRRATQGRLAFDEEGAMAAAGTPDEDLLERLLGHEFFRQPPPRSTGRESFGEAYLDRVVEEAAPSSTEAWQDLVATLTALTAVSVARSYREFGVTESVDEVILLGGGALNPTLVGMIREVLDPLPVEVGGRAVLGVDPEEREALCFALLGWAHLMGLPGNIPGATGARGPRILGSLTPGRKE
jgi:anhydro-N-acetylmuramic acid kinase